MEANHPLKSKRAQGRPGAGRNPWPASKWKSWRQSPQVWPNARPSLRDGFNAVLRALPRDRAFLPLSRADRSAHLTPASGCQDHTTSASARKCVSSHALSRPSHPRLTCRDDSAYVPLAEAGCADHAPDLGSTSSQFPKNRTHPLRQIGTTGNLRMAPMHQLPVVQIN